jgi:hypothetical protein
LDLRHRPLSSFSHQNQVEPIKLIR